MVRTPKKHGLDRKYKSWRRGKSQRNGDTDGGQKGSLKHQLRGARRFLSRVGKNDPEKRKVLEEKIASLEGEIAKKERTDRQRENASNSHGIRFIERQKLVRMERSIGKKIKEATLESQKEALRAERYQVALDQAYVAHYPHDIKYLSIFRTGGMRAVDGKRNLYKRASTRRRILEKIRNNEVSRVDWITPSQYEILPKEWSTDLERKTFGCLENKSGTLNSTAVSDGRFELQTEHQRILETADQMEAALDEESALNEEGDDTKGSNPIEDQDAKKGMEGSEDSESSVESSHSKDGKISADTNMTFQKVPQNDDSDSSSGNSESSSSSSSSSNSSSSEETSTLQDNSVELQKRDQKPDAPEMVWEDDDFLVSASNEEVFKHARQERDHSDFGKGDKSQGWATQKQHQRRFNKRRRRGA